MNPRPPLRKRPPRGKKTAEVAKADSSTTLNVSLPESMKAFVERLVQSGSYTSASEFVRELIRERMRVEETERRHQALAKNALGSLPQPIEARRFLEAIGLFEAGVKMVEERVTREHPAASPAEIGKLVSDWLHPRERLNPSDEGLGHPVSPERLRRLRGE
jgi:antitoxin ParD1/3/4